MVRVFSFGERWNVPFNSAVASLNGTFHLSPNENILTIARIKIHYLYTNKLSLVGMRLPEKYKENFNVSSEGPSIETSKFSKYFLGSCIPTNESLLICLALTQTVQDI